MLWASVDVLGRRLVLWAVISVGVGAVLLTGADPWWRGLGTMFVAWGGIDGLIGRAAMWFADRNRRRHRGDQATIDRETRRLRRILWLNAGLDVGYVAGGAWVVATAAAPFGAGVGAGIVVQGAFLLVFDILHARWVPAPQPIFHAGMDLFMGAEHRPFRLAAESTIGTTNAAAPGDGAVPEDGAVPADGAVPGDGTGDAIDDPLRDGPPRRPGALLVHGFGGSPAEMRGLAALLASDGWVVEVPLLPGFGPEIRSLPDVRAADWLEEVRVAHRRLRETAPGPLLVVGHSMGASLAFATARELNPDGLVVLAPFWWPVPAWLRVVGPVARALLPPGIRPFRRLDLDAQDVRGGIASFLPGMHLDDPEVRGHLRDLVIPISIFDQLLHASSDAHRAMPGVRVPVLAIQGLQDTVSRPGRTRRLLAGLPVPPELVELEAGHDLLTPASPVRDLTYRAVLRFARTVRGFSA